MQVNLSQPSALQKLQSEFQALAVCSTDSSVAGSTPQRSFTAPRMLMTWHSQPESEVTEEGSVRSAQLCDRTLRAKAEMQRQSFLPSISNPPTTCSKGKRFHKRGNYGKVKGGMNSSTHTSDSERASSRQSGLKLIPTAAPSPSRAQITSISTMLSILSHQQAPGEAGWVVGEAHKGYACSYCKQL